MCKGNLFKTITLDRGMVFRGLKAMTHKLELQKTPNDQPNQMKSKCPEQNGHATEGYNTKINQGDELNDDIYLEERIDVPEPDGTLFSWRKLWLFTGPGWLSKYLSQRLDYYLNHTNANEQGERECYNN